MAPVLLLCAFLASNAPTPYQMDTPPPTPYDLQVQQAPLGVPLETQSLLAYAGRVLMALVAVLALIYATSKVLLPRFYKKWSARSGRDMEVVERLPLDGRNAVVVLRLASGERFVVGTGEHGVQFLTHLQPPLQPPPAADFRRDLRQTSLSSGHAGEDRHADSH